MSVIDATLTEIKLHPALTIGVVVGVVVLSYVAFHGSSSTPQSTTLQYSLGPSDAVVNANAAISVAQIQAGATTNAAQINADATTANYAVASQTSLAAARIAANTSVSNTKTAANVSITNAKTAANVSTQNTLTQANSADALAMYSYLGKQADDALQSHMSDNSVTINQADQKTISDNNYYNYINQAQLQSQAYDVKTKSLANDAAIAGSTLSILQGLDQSYNTDIWSAVGSGQSTATIDELRQAMQQSVFGINNFISSGAIDTAFSG